MESRHRWSLLGVVGFALLVGWAGYDLITRSLLRGGSWLVWTLGPVALLVAAFIAYRGSRGRISEGGFEAAMRDFGTALVVAAAGGLASMVAMMGRSPEHDPALFWGSIVLAIASGVSMLYGLIRFARWRNARRRLGTTNG